MRRFVYFSLSFAALLVGSGTISATRSASAWQVPPVGTSGPVVNLPVTDDLPRNVRVRNLSVNILNQASAVHQGNSDITAARTLLDEQKRKLNELQKEPPPPGSGETARREHQSRIAEAQREVEQRLEEFSSKFAAAARDQIQFKQTQAELVKLQEDPEVPRVDPQEIWKLYADKVPAAGKEMPAGFKMWDVINWNGFGDLPVAELRPGPGGAGDPLPLTKPSDLAAWEVLEAAHGRCVDLHKFAAVLLTQVTEEHDALERAAQELTEQQAALVAKQADFYGLSSPSIDYALYNRCPEGNPWPDCDHEDLKQQWLREQMGDYYRDKDRLRAQYAEQLNRFESARFRLESDIADYSTKQSELQNVSDALEKETALYRELLQKYRMSP